MDRTAQHAALQRRAVIPCRAPRPGEAHQDMSRFVSSLAVVAVVLALVGCGGGDDGAVNPPGPVPNPDNAVVRGYVVQGDGIATPVANATVSEGTTGLSTPTGGTGWFSLSGLPGQEATISVSAPGAVGYQGVTLAVPTLAGRTTDVVVTLPPISLGTPTGLTVNPSAAEVEAGGTLQLSARVMSGATELSVQPSWVLYYGNQTAPGSLSSQGVFTASNAGNATVKAILGGLKASSTVTVRPASPPVISTLLLSRTTANPVPASGGTVSFTAAISDGDGVLVTSSGGLKGVRFEVINPAGETETVYAGDPVAGDIKDGTWTRDYAVPANSNVPGTDGVQATQLYSVRVVACDLAGREARSNYQDFLVAGVDAPPPLP